MAAKETIKEDLDLLIINVKVPTFALAEIMLLLPPGLTPPHLYVAGEEVWAMGMISVVTREHRGHVLHEHGVMSSCS